MAKWLNDLYKEYMEEVLEEEFANIKRSEAVIGGVYFGSLKMLDETKPNKPLFFLVIDKIDNKLYEVLKVSEWHMFATPSDLILNIGTMNVIIETDNNFYLTKDEINRFINIYEISQQLVKEILAFRDTGKIENLETGFTPLFEDDIRYQFKKQEFEAIKDYHMRIFEILAEPEEQVIELAPDRINDFILKQVASTSQKATYAENFILFRGEDFIEIIIDEKYLNKKVRIFLNNDIIFDDILKDTSIFIPVEKEIDLDKLAKHITIRVEG